MNQGVHTVDLLVATLGRPVEVFAYTGTLAHERIEVEDVAVGVVRFESGALGVLHATTAAYPGLSARLQVHGDQGSVIIDNDELSFIHLTPTTRRQTRRAYGQSDTRSTRSRTTRTPPGRPPAAGSDPGRLVRRAPAPVRELPRRPGTAEEKSGSTWRRTARPSRSSPASTSPPGPVVRWRLR